MIGILAKPCFGGREEYCRVVGIKKITFLKLHKPKLTPEAAPFFGTSSDVSGTSELPPIILRALRVARSELVYTSWKMLEKNFDEDW